MGRGQDLDCDFSVEPSARGDLVWHGFFTGVPAPPPWTHRSLDACRTGFNLSERVDAFGRRVRSDILG